MYKFTCGFMSGTIIVSYFNHNRNNKQIEYLSSTIAQYQKTIGLYKNFLISKDLLNEYKIFTKI